MLGGITAAFLIHRLGERSVVAMALVALGVGIGVAVVPSIPVVVGAVIPVGISIPWFVVGFITLRQRLTPARLQGRVSAATNMALNGPQTVGTATGAVLIGLVDYRVLMVVMAVSVALCALPIVALGSAGRTSGGTGLISRSLGVRGRNQLCARVRLRPWKTRNAQTSVPSGVSPGWRSPSRSLWPAPPFFGGSQARVSRPSG